MKIKKIPTEDIAITYKTSLLQHRESIIHNKYARELESRYHKSNQKSYTFTPKKSPNQTPINTHLWPVHNKMFIRVLKSKLNDVLVPSQAKKKENLGIDTRLSFEKIRKVLRTSDGRLRTANGKHELKDISLLAVDFAGGNLPRRPKGSQPRMRPMTSKSNSNSINQRKNLAGQKTKPNLSPLKIGLNFTYVDDPRESSIENQDHILEHDTSREREEFRLLRSPRYQIE